MTQEELDSITDNITPQGDLDEQQSRIDKNKAEIQLQQQKLELQQQQQDTQQLLVIGGLGIGAALVLVVAIYLFTKAFKGKKK